MQTVYQKPNFQQHAFENLPSNLESDKNNLKVDFMGIINAMHPARSSCQKTKTVPMCSAIIQDDIGKTYAANPFPKSIYTPACR